MLFNKRVPANPPPNKKKRKHECKMKGTRKFKLTTVNVNLIYTYRVFIDDPPDKQDAKLNKYTAICCCSSINCPSI